MDTSVVPANTQFLSEIDAIISSPAEVQTDWVIRAGNMVLAWDHLRALTTMREAEILYAMHRIWPTHENDNEQRLSWEAVAPWDSDFFKWARAYTKKQNREPANVTILNKVAVFKDWASGESTIELPEQVYIPRRDHTGQIVDPGSPEEDAWVAVDFNPREVDYSKLLAARTAAKRGEVTPEAWTALADPYATQNDVIQALKGDETRNGGSDDKSELRIWYSDGLVYASQDEVTAAIMMVLEDSIDLPLVRLALSRILGAFGENLPDDLGVSDIDDALPVVTKAEDAVVLSAAGHKFMEFSGTAELIALRDMADDILANRGIVTSELVTDF